MIPSEADRCTGFSEAHPTCRPHSERTPHMNERLLVPTVAMALWLGLSTPAWAEVRAVWSEDFGKQKIGSPGKTVVFEH